MTPPGEASPASLVRMGDETLAAPPPPAAPGSDGSVGVPGDAGALSGQAARLRRGMRRPQNWTQLVRFCVVGGSGYVLNLCVFAVAAEGLGIHHLPSAIAAFLVAISNNFYWNRHWTFRAGGGRASPQAARYLTVNVTSLAFQLAILELLVSVIGWPKVLGQAVSIGAQVPLNFLGNKVWTFGLGVPRA